MRAWTKQILSFLKIPQIVHFMKFTDVWWQIYWWAKFLQRKFYIDSNSKNLQRQILIFCVRIALKPFAFLQFTTNVVTRLGCFWDFESFLDLTKDPEWNLTYLNKDWTLRKSPFETLRFCRNSETKSINHWEGVIFATSSCFLPNPIVLSYQDSLYSNNQVSSPVFLT